MAEIVDRFTKFAEDGRMFTDALYFTIDEYETLTELEIEAMRQERFDAWLQAASVATQQQSPVVGSQLLQILEIIEQVQVSVADAISVEEVQTAISTMADSVASIIGT